MKQSFLFVVVLGVVNLGFSQTATVTTRDAAQDKRISEFLAVPLLDEKTVQTDFSRVDPTTLLDSKMIHHVDPSIDRGIYDAWMKSHNSSDVEATGRYVPDGVRVYQVPGTPRFQYDASPDSTLDKMLHQFKFAIPLDKNGGAMNMFNGDSLHLELPRFKLDLPNPLIIPDPHK